MTDDSVGGWATRMKFRTSPARRPVEGYFSSEVERLEAKMKLIRERRAFANSSRKERILLNARRYSANLEDYL